MLIDIGIKDLESILKDGIREMMNQVAGRSQNAKKRAWVGAVKAAIREYQRKIQKDFLPVLLEDFSSEKVVKVEARSVKRKKTRSNCS